MDENDLFSNLSDDDKSQVLLKQAIAALESGDFQQRWDAAKQLVKLGTIAIHPLISILEDEDSDPEVRWFVARTLGEYDSEAVVPALVNVLQTANTENSSETSLLEMVATALANLGTGAVASLTILLENEQLKLLATQALAQIQSSEIITPLLSVVNDSNPEVRASAMAALSSFPDPQILPVFVDALSDPVAAVRKEAIIGLSLRGDLVTELNVVEQIQPLLWDIRPEVCQQAQIALSRLGTDQAVMALVEQIQSPTTPPTVKLEGVRSLCWIETPIALDQIEQILFTLPNQSTSTHSTFLIHQEIIQGLGRIHKRDLKTQASQILIQFLESQHPALQLPIIKQLVALSLGQLGNIAAFDVLVQLLADSQTTVQLHAIAALKQLNSALDYPLIYEKLQRLAQQNDLDSRLQQGISTALAEWQ